MAVIAALVAAWRWRLPPVRVVRRCRSNSRVPPENQG
jgi:hypothetical protein